MSLQFSIGAKATKCARAAHRRKYVGIYIVMRMRRCSWCMCGCRCCRCRCSRCVTARGTATHCNALQHTATYCTTLHHTARELLATCARHARIRLPSHLYAWQKYPRITLILGYLHHPYSTPPYIYTHKIYRVHKIYLVQTWKDLRET